jgi:hypothetical protein
MTTEAEVFDSLKYRIVCLRGAREYYNHAGKLHRVEGPAVEYANGDMSWWLNGCRHRIGGPAIEWDGNKRWFLHGVEYTEDAYYHQLKTLGHTV